MRFELRRAWLAGAWALGMLVFAGCGPGVGGTGTGGAALFAFGASPVSVCSGAVAAELACPSGPAGPVAMGTQPVQFVDAAAHVTLQVSGNTAQLDAFCLRLSFSGEFGRSAGGAEGYFGGYEVGGNGVEALAALSVVPAAGGGLTVELRDLAGHVVVGPVLLLRATGPLPPPGPC